MNKIIQHLQNNPMEAAAVMEGRAMPVGNLKPTELLKIVQALSVGVVTVPMGYWG